MPLALLVTEPGDVRDAVGLFLAGKGWTTVPVGQDPERFAAELAAVGPTLVAVDFRGDPRGAARCAEIAAGVAGVDVRLLNVPAELAAAMGERAPGARAATGAGDLPRAPGTQDPPH